MLHLQIRDRRTGGYREALAKQRNLAPCHHSLVNAVETSKPQSKFATSNQCKIKPHVGLQCPSFSFFPVTALNSEINAISVVLS